MLSDTKVYEPQIRARLGTTVYLCQILVLKLRDVGAGRDCVPPVPVRRAPHRRQPFCARPSIRTRVGRIPAILSAKQGNVQRRLGVVLKWAVWGAGGDSVPPFPVRRAASGLHGPRGLLHPYRPYPLTYITQPLTTISPDLHYSTPINQTLCST